MSIAGNGVESRKGRACDAAYVSRGSAIIRVRPDSGWNLLQDSRTNVVCYVGWYGGVRYGSRSSGLPTGKE